MASVYVVAVLGSSPAVLFELIWWLSAVQRSHIVGVELWTTQPCEARLREEFQDTWQVLEQATAPMPTLQAPGPPSTSPGVRIHVFSDAEGPLPDVRTAAQSTCVSATVHDRVRTLRRELDPSVALVGSLAGGRKTMSASLQTAFSLQAHADDRLVHVLLHPKLEAFLIQQGALGDYRFPSQRWQEQTGVAVPEQVIVYDVAFPRLRCVVPERLQQALDALPWESVWPALDTHRNDSRSATLQQAGPRWHYTVHDADGSQLFHQSLAPRSGSLLAACVAVGAQATGHKLVDWLDSQPPSLWLWRTPEGPDESRLGSLRTAATKLRNDLAQLPVGLEAFGLPAKGYVIEGQVRVVSGP